MTFPELLDRVGGFGPFQFLHLTLIGLPVLGMANHFLLQIFTATTPAHHCRPPPNASAGPWVLPTGPDGKPEKCLRFIHLPNASLPNGTQGATEPCLDGWIYISTRDSIVSEWDLVCDSYKMKELAQSIFMAGVLIGGIVLGNLSDRFGRKTILSGSYLLLAASGCCTAFSPTFLSYLVFRFLTGSSMSGISLSTVILNVEWVPTRVRAILSTAVGYCYTTGQFILPGLAYVIPQWRWLQLTVSLPFFIVFLWSWWIAESVRWMVLKVLKGPEDTTMGRCLQWQEEGEKLTLEELKLNLQKEIALAKVKYSVVDLIRTSTLRLLLICLSLAWFSTGFAYYSLAMGVEDFGVNIYLLQIIFAGADVPAKFITILSMSYLGRRITQAASLLLAGGSILVLTFVPSDLQTLRTVLAVFGKGCLSSSFSCLFLYTSELYPTVIRQTGLGLSNLWARVGSMMAPVVKILAEVQPFIPNVIYGGMALLGGSAALLLPETLNTCQRPSKTWTTGQPLPLAPTVLLLGKAGLGPGLCLSSLSPGQAKEPEQDPEAEKASQRIPLQPHDRGL
uniref:Solute carrier family 22 member 8 n=1 Tax=Loxodonta africana TaxID=9785 RepID=G3SV36_LOXAF